MEYNPGAVWPVMVTPFTDGGDVDLGSLEGLTRWYLERGVGGFFTNCAMSEMVALSIRERGRFIAGVKKHSNVPVAATCNLSYSFADQTEEIKVMEASGADICVFLTNRVALPGESTEMWIEKLDALINQTGSRTKLGLYEWPGHPGVWKLSDDELDFAVKTGRFVFMKDTCCRLDILARRAKIAAGTQMRLYNANAASYLASLRMGYSGFCGIMSNFHPEIYAWLADHYKDDENLADLAQSFLTVASYGEGRVSPVSAKWHISGTGAPIGIRSRVRDSRELSALNRYETEQMALLADWVKSALGIEIKESDGIWRSRETITKYQSEKIGATIKMLSEKQTEITQNKSAGNAVIQI